MGGLVEMIKADCRVYDLYPGYACNAKCLFCFNPAEPKRPDQGYTFERVAREMYTMHRSGHRHMNVLGGEPTVRRDLHRIIALAKKTGFYTVAITTNGIRTASPAPVRRLADAGLDLAMHSVHGHTPELHDTIVGVPGALQKVFRSIKNFQDAGVSVQVAVVAHRLNHRLLSAFFETFLKRGVEKFTILYLRYHGHMDIKDDQRDGLKVRMSEVARSIQTASEMFLKRGLKTPRLCHILPCVLPGYESRMDNLIFPEDAVSDGYYLDPETKSKSSTWIDHKDKVKPPRCGRCVMNDICPGAEKAYLQIFGDKEIRPLLKRPLPFVGMKGRSKR